MSGYVRAQRARFAHHLFTGEKFCRGYAWDWMVAQARFSDCRINANGKTVALRRGQFTHSIRFMAAAWNWDRGAVDRFITRLKTETMIETATETGQLIITICNYDEYQADQKDAVTDAETANGTRAGQQRDSSVTKKNNDERRIKDLDKKTEDISCSPAEEFERIWPHYPKRVEKAAAKAEWIKARKSHSFEAIAEPLREYCRCRKGQDPHFTISLGRWLKRERWTDEQSHAANRPRTSTEDLANLATVSLQDELAALMPPTLRIVSQ